MSILNILELVELLKTINSEGVKAVDWEINEGDCVVWTTDNEGCYHYFVFCFDEPNKFERGNDE